MEKPWVWFSFLLSILLFSVSPSTAQLASSERRILFQVQQFLEYPQVLQGWNNWTNFCSLPQSASLVIVCTGNHITELTIVGNKSSPSQNPKPSSANLSQGFSIDSFFTVITKLSNLKKLSLVSLGIWGPLPSTIGRFDSLEVLNISSNFIRGSMPQTITNFKNLTSLVLADNLLSGSTPDLKSLTHLEEIDFSDNPLGPQFPSLHTNLVRMNLRNMSLRSEIPPDIAKFTRLQSLDVSSNKLQGPIPSFLFSLPSIQYINLAKNQLSGTLPATVSCQQNLNFVDVSNNLLIGKLPSCLGSNSQNRTVISTWNCLSNTSTKLQRPYSFCQKEALAVQPTTSKNKKAQSTIKLGIVLGIIAAIVAIIGAFGLLVLVIYKRKERKRDKEYKSESFVFDKNAARGSSPLVDGRNMPRTMRMVSMGLPPYQVFTLEEIEEATKDFANLVGEVSQAQLYRGWLGDGTVVLVKCMKLKHKQSPQNLQQHMEVISRLRHRHLVSVLGHCIVAYQDHPNIASTVFLVLENVASGSLRDHLSDWRKREILKWPQRMSIIMSVAKGIQYLHSAGVVGNDIKIEHLLLDESLSAKISSYNISLPTKAGPEGHLIGQENPISSGENAEKEDIYQLGIILLEVITGRPIISKSEADDLQLQLEICLAESPSKLKELTDPSIIGSYAYESLKTIAQITINCLNKESSRRPSIEDILWHMQYSVQVQEGWASSGNLSGNSSKQF